mmetsp:Transcript_35724/g.96970  ORF Transcript_35724/g.96970 Transcript_35724/m.96970 type:complete len:206 (-) Transcript_35724:348-965(-)
MQGLLHIVCLLQQLQHLPCLGGDLLLSHCLDGVPRVRLGALPGVLAGNLLGLLLGLGLCRALDGGGAPALATILHRLAALVAQLSNGYLLRVQNTPLLGTHVLHRGQHPHGAVHALLHFLQVQVPALAEALKDADAVLELLAPRLEHADFVLLALRPRCAVASATAAAEKCADGARPQLLVLRILHVQLHEDAAVVAQQGHHAVL